MQMALEDIFSKYPKARREDLIPMLQEIQELRGCLDEESIIAVGGYLSISISRIYSLITFYDNFRFRPDGKNHIVICRGTTCYLNRSEEIVNAIREEMGIVPGETSNDGMFSLEMVSCLGSCHIGPVFSVNGKVISIATGENIKRVIRDLKSRLKDGKEF